MPDAVEKPDEGLAQPTSAEPATSRLRARKEERFMEVSD
jgi:hypothetical protein